MTNRINAVVVVLEQDMREDDAQELLTCLRRLRGVLSVTPHVRDIGDIVAAQRTKARLHEALLEALKQDD